MLKYHMEECWMSAEMKTTNNHDSNITISEILFGTLLGIGALSCIWVSTTLLIHLYQNIL